MLDALWYRRARAVPAPSKSPPRVMRSLGSVEFNQQTSSLVEHSSGVKRRRSYSPDDPKLGVEDTKPQVYRPHKVRFVYHKHKEFEDLKEQVKDLIRQRDSVQTKLQEVSDQFARQEEEKQEHIRNLAAVEEALQLAAMAAAQGHARAQESENQSTALDKAHLKIKALEDEVDRLSVHASLTINEDENQHRDANVGELRAKIRTQDDEIQFLRTSLAGTNATASITSQQESEMRHLKAELSKTHAKLANARRDETTMQGEEILRLRGTLSKVEASLSESQTALASAQATAASDATKIDNLKTTLSAATSIAVDRDTEINNLKIELADARADQTAKQDEEVLRLQGALLKMEASLFESQTALTSAQATTVSDATEQGRKIGNLETALSAATSIAANRDTKINSLKTELADARADQNKATAQNEEILRLRGALSKVEASLSESQTALASARATAASDATEQGRKISNLKTKLSAATSIAVDRDTEINNLKIELADARADQTAKQDEEILRLQGALSKMEALLFESQTALASAQATATSDATEQGKKISNLEIELSAATSIAADQNTEINNLKAELAGARTDQTAAEALKNKVAAQDEEILRLRRVLSNMETSLSESQTALSSARASLSVATSDAADQGQKISNLETELADARADLTTTQTLNTEIETQGEEIARLRRILSDTETSLSQTRTALTTTRTSLSAAAANSADQVKKISDLETELSSMHAKDLEIQRLSNSLDRNDIATRELMVELDTLKASLADAEAEKILSAREFIRLQATLAASLREQGQLRSTVQQQQEALRNSEEERQRRDSQIDELRLQTDSLNEAVSSLNERLRLSQDLLHEEHIRYTQLGETHDQVFDDAVEERERLTAQLDRAESAAQEERNTHQRAMEERDAALAHGRIELDRLREQLEEGRRALEEQRSESECGPNSGQIARLNAIIEAQNVEIEITEQLVTVLRDEMDTRDAHDNEQGLPNGQSAKVLGKRKASGSSSLLLALAHSPSKKRAVATPRRAPSTTPSLAHTPDDVRIRALRMPSDNTTRTTTSALRTTSGFSSQHRQATSGPSNHQQESTPSGSPLEPSNGEERGISPLHTPSGTTVRTEIPRGSSRQPAGQTLACNHRQATPGPSNQQLEGTPSRPIPYAPLQDVEGNTSFSPLGAIPEEDAPYGREGGSPYALSCRDTPRPSSRVGAPIPQPSFSMEARPASALPRTPGPSRYRRASSVPHNRGGFPGSSVRQPGPFSSPFSSPFRPSSLSQDASPTHQGGEVLEALNRLGQQVKNMEHRLMQIQPQQKQSQKSPQRDPSSPYKPKAERRTRDPERVSLQSAMRPMMNKMLGIGQDKDIVTAVDDGHMVTQEEADALLLNEDDMMDNLQFMKPLWSSITSDYNRHLASIFWTAFIEKYPGFVLEEDDGKAYFKQRLKTLRSEISSHAPAPGESEEQTAERIEATYLAELERNRGRKRKWEGFAGRIEDVEKAAESNPDYEPILEVLTELGVDGYSSDETCDEPEGYAVKWLPWRNRKMKKVVNMANQARRTHGINGNRLSGPSKRRRLYHTYPPVSTSRAPQKLPINFYDEDWYYELSPEKRRGLKAKALMPFPGEHDDV